MIEPGGAGVHLREERDQFDRRVFHRVDAVFHGELEQSPPSPVGIRRIIATTASASGSPNRANSRKADRWSGVARTSPGAKTRRARL